MNRPRIDKTTIPDISARLRLLRIAMKGADEGAVTEFARASGFGVQRWWHWENASGRISLDNAIKLVERWNGVTLDWLYLGDEYGLHGAVLDELEEMRRPKRVTKKRAKP